AAAHIAPGTPSKISARRFVLCEPVRTEAATPGSPAAEVVIYSSAICPYCIAAKNFLKSKGQAWREVRIDLDPAEREKMTARTRRTSVPQIFIGETHVGGYDDT